MLYDLFFHFLKCVIQRAEVLNFDEIWCINVFFYGGTIVWIKILFCLPKDHEDSLLLIPAA